MPKVKHALSKHAAARAEDAAARAEEVAARSGTAAEDNGPTSLKWRPGSADEGSSRGSAAKQRAKDMRKAVERRTMERLLAREQPRNTVQERELDTLAPGQCCPPAESSTPTASGSGSSSSSQSPTPAAASALLALLTFDRLPEVLWLEVLGHLESAADLCAAEAC